MTADAGGAPVRLTVNAPLPVAASAGSDLLFTVQAACDQGHDRSGLAVVLIAPDGATSTYPVHAHQDGISEAAVALKAPARLGEHVFRLLLPAHSIAGSAYAEASLDIPVRVRPQATSLAVWDVPSPVVAGSRFVIKAGAKSAADCPLADRVIEACDRTMARVSRGTLSAAPLPGTAALYWCALELTAPAREGLATFAVRFAAEGLDLPHEDAVTTFATAVVPPPEHRLTVRLVERETATPIADAELRLGPYRGTTGPAGVAEIALPKGRYELNVWKVGYEAPSRPLDIAADAVVEIEALPVAEEDPDARWKM
jgi:hypothetical protein